MTSLWQYLIVRQPARAGDPAHVLKGANTVFVTDKPDVVAHTILMAWRSQGVSADWPRTECWARRPTHTEVCGVAYGRDWA